MDDGLCFPPQFGQNSASSATLAPQFEQKGIWTGVSVKFARPEYSATIQIESVFRKRKPKILAGEYAS
jgi:hypothetical protein